MQISQVTVIGAGGTGQQLIPSLMRMLQYHSQGTDNVAVYDGDQFEEHNGARQINISGSKADRLNELLEKQMLAPVCRDQYMSASKLQAMRQRKSAQTDGAHLVIAAVDNDATRKMCIDILLDTPGDFLFVTPGNSDASEEDKDIKGNVLWFGRVGDQQVGLNPALLFPNIEHPSDGIPRKGSCLDDAVSTPQLIAANALAAAYTLTVVQNFLDDKMPFEASNCFFNGRSLQLTVS
jgi:hypothetical protein